MPKYTTYPTLFNEVLQIRMNKLKEWGYLKPNTIKMGTINWSWDGTKRSSIDILVDMSENKPFLELNYKCNGEPIKYQIPLVWVPSNLGKGKLWYFLCPHTRKRCRVLYSIGSYFFHRDAAAHGMYESQTESKKKRDLYRQFDKLNRAEAAHKKMNAKCFKNYYNGKPTKRYPKLLKELQAGANISLEELILR